MTAGGAPSPPARTARTAPAPPPREPAARGGGPRPVVWVQAGHREPREPGYRAQTGAGSGPLGSEAAFTADLAPRVAARLRRAGADARAMPGLVRPWGARGAAFVSLHHDTPEGAAAIGHAIAGEGENWYRGEGAGEPADAPYPDSAPHRAATDVPPEVERLSRDLAERLARRYRAIFTTANGARSRFAGVQTRAGNRRMMRFYGFYRTRADARVIVEAGAGGTDDAFLRRADLIAEAVSAGVVDHLRARGLLR